METKNTQPVDSIKEGRAKVSIFKTAKKDGGSFYTASLSSLYKNGENWVHGKSFTEADLKNLQLILEAAIEKLSQLNA